MQKRLSAVSLMGLFALFLLLGGCAKNSATHELISDSATEKINQPDLNNPSDSTFHDLTDDNYAEATDSLEFINRPIFFCNDHFYDYIYFPITDTYEKIIPRPVKTGITNVFHNLTTPVRVAGDLMQLKGEKAIVDASSAVFNTLFGVLGIADIYTIDDAFDDEDVSQGFASWGIPEGPYIVWPFVGPSNVRNTVGAIGNALLTPQTYLGFPDSALASVAETTNAYGTTNPYREIVAGALDPYSAIKDAYLSNFKKKLGR
ncbi:MAG: VacJ family lipoprotein [Parcubacteria group bacterium]|jgi:phospholipid-binding lipoprotein MlaA